MNYTDWCLVVVAIALFLVAWEVDRLARDIRAHITNNAAQYLNIAKRLPRTRDEEQREQTRKAFTE